jgi:hypothetical protein
MVPFACIPSPIPGRSDGTCSLLLFHQLRPSHEPGRVGSCIVGFGAYTAFTHVTACTLAKSPSDSLHQRLRQFRCLHCRSDCYRVERNSSPAGYSRCGPPPFTTHPVFPTTQMELACLCRGRFMAGRRFITLDKANTGFPPYLRRVPPCFAEFVGRTRAPGKGRPPRKKILGGLIFCCIFRSYWQPRF